MIAFIVITIIKAVVILAVIAALAGLATYAERKVLGFMHRRIGPWAVGPAGVAQIVADMIKLFTKECVTPEFANKFMFKIAPLISVVGAFTALAVVPFLPEFELFGITVQPILSDINVAVLFLLGVCSTSIYGLLVGGLASYNKFAMIASMRTVLQIISFEVVNGLSLVPIVMIVGSMSIIDIVNYQAGGIGDWFLWKQPVCFVLFWMASCVECNRLPFCLTENDTELVAGSTTAYSGMQFGVFFIAEYANMVTYSIVLALLFCGGFNSWWIIPGGIMMILKSSFFFFGFLWFRGAWPHLRPDQTLGLCWKVLFPLALACVFITGVVLI